MGRKKSTPVDLRGSSPAPPPVVKPGARDATTIILQSTITTAPICTKCRLEFVGLSGKDFDDHVEKCSTTVPASTTSPLSSPPSSPAINSLELNAQRPNEKEIVVEVQAIIVQSPSSEPLQNGDSDPLCPFVDSKFEYYGQDAPEELDEVKVSESLQSRTPEPNGIDSKPVDTTSNLPTPDPVVSTTNEVSASPTSTPKSDLAKKVKKTKVYPFAKLTSADVFVEQLSDAADLTYDELYSRTARTSEALAAYQYEFDVVEKEIKRAEAVQAAEKKRSLELAKQLQDMEEDRDDAARQQVQSDFKKELKLKGPQWVQFFTEYERTHPGSEVVKQMLNLKNPQFMAGANKKRKRVVKNHAELYESIPWVATKPSKEEADFERQKRGRLLDPIKFDDMKGADVYGVEYSSHAKHYGNQPIEERAHKRRLAQAVDGDRASANGAEGGETSRSRTQRKPIKRPYEVELSPTPESDDDGLPAKRARRPKVFEDGIEVSGRSRTQSRSGTPSAPKTFASGRRVGRPPKSKLQDVQMAPETSNPIDESRDWEVHGYNGVPRQLDSLQEAQLQNAAETLNETILNAGAASIFTNPYESPGAVAKPRNKGGRPRKQPDAGHLQPIFKPEIMPQPPSINFGNDSGILQSTEQGDGELEQQLTSSGRPRRKRATIDTENNLEDFADFEASPTAKKRNTIRVFKENSEDDEFQGNSGPRSKRKRDGTSEARPMDVPMESEVVPKKRKTKNKVTLVEPPPEETEEAPIDESQMTEEQRKAAKDERTKKEKSRKLSESMKKRWARGDMATAQTTRKNNTERKKREKEEAARQMAGSMSSHMGVAPIPMSFAGPSLAPLAPLPVPQAVFVPAPAYSTSSASGAAVGRALKPINTKKLTVPRKTTRAPAKRGKPGRAKKTVEDIGMDGAADPESESDSGSTSSDGRKSPKKPALYDLYQQIASPTAKPLEPRKRNSMKNIFEGLEGEESEEEYEEARSESFFS